jgi:hypothetical protein
MPRINKVFSPLSRGLFGCSLWFQWSGFSLQSVKIEEKKKTGGCSEHDYKINLKAELEIKLLSEKLIACWLIKMAQL